MSINKDVICHAEGDRCHGCDHYWGRAPVCVFAPKQNPPPERESGHTLTGEGGERTTSNQTAEPARSEVPAPARWITLDEYELAALAIRAFGGVTQPRITRTKWKDGIDLEVATPGLKELANIIVQRELSSAQEQIAALQRQLADSNYWRERWCREQEAASKQSGENWLKLKEAKEQIAALREALTDQIQWVAAFAMGCGQHDVVMESDRMKRALAALAATRKEPEHG